MHKSLHLILAILFFAEHFHVCLGSLKEAGDRVGLAQEIILNLLKYVLLPLFKRLDCGVRVEGKDFLDIMIEGAHL